MGSQTALDEVVNEELQDPTLRLIESDEIILEFGDETVNCILTGIQTNFKLFWDG